MKRSESYYHMAENVRRDLADLLFDPNSIANNIHELAALGHRSYRIEQDEPFDLSDTDAAKALEIWLDQEQFHYAWRPTYVPQDGLRLTHVTEYPELVIMW